MVWLVSGEGSELVFSVDATGKQQMHGEARHEPRPVGMNDFGANIDEQILKRIQKSSCVWSVVGTDAADAQIDWSGSGFLERVRAAPEEGHTMIRFFASSDQVTFSFVLPPTHMHRLQRLLELVVQQPTLHYSFQVPFIGFRVPHAQTSTPTWQEFADSKPYVDAAPTFSASAQRDA